ncbi:hypothetical protein A11A3_11923 [Alcanivorax hongdengensis A-11-3]|uniref:Uncharacterized protein n=1 Tax=Alcanivorax hongdengensis A-11-3 TaxID=1177179 RepID=L0WCF2_9GAMM|nr:putative sulfate exporter family transporter [Alcanivorax hongdengensis]EKF73787.1 hypothetical protein A11A3_11923 [Alcanivorax hongdengensis A-11-3]
MNAFARDLSLPAAVLTLTCGLGALSLASLPAAQALGLSALALALLAGLVLAHTLSRRQRQRAASTLNLFKGPVLKAAIVLYALRIPLDAVKALGSGVILLDALLIAMTLAAALLIGRRWLGMNTDAALLIGAGSGICGAAAVLAAEPVVKGKERDVAMAVATVVLFGSLNMLLLPVLFHWLPALFQSERDFAIYTGATVQEVAQVIVAANAMHPALVDTALLTKMVRIMMLAPALLVLGSLYRPPATGGQTPTQRQVRVPLFALLFLGMLMIHAMVPLPTAVQAWLAHLDDVLLALAMAALGLTTHLGLLRQAGWKPLLLGASLWLLLLVAGGLALHLWPL